jgi:hypothetical protein
MKKLIGIISIIGLIYLGSCDNANRGIEDNEEADNNLIDQRDTSEIKGAFNPRGVPAEGLNDHNAIRDGSIEVESDTNGIMDAESNEIMADLPAEITKKIMEDENLRKKRLTNSRQYSEGGTNFYELSFDNGERTTITFDERGNESLSKNPRNE